MKKLSLLLTLFSLLGCRSPQEATQTVIRIRATPGMQELIKSVKAQVIALPKDVIVSPETEEKPSWPMKWTLVPESEHSSHRFRFAFEGSDESGSPVTKLDIQADIVEGASRYLYILLSEDCLSAKCKDGVCRAVVGAAALRTSPDQAQELESGCMGGSLAQPPGPSMSPGNAAMAGNAGDGSSPPTADNHTVTGAAPNMTGTAASGGSGSSGGPAVGVDASTPGKVTVPSTQAECTGNPCAPNGTCSLSSSAPKHYECNCDPGFAPDEAGATCVVRNDCKTNQGGCEDHCEPATLGEAQCSCTGPTRWLKGDAKQCAEVQPKAELSVGLGSVDRTRPQVAFDPAGNGVVAWTETSDNGTYSLWTARYDAGTKQWHRPTAPFQLGTFNAADLHLSLDASGSGVLLWTATVESRRQLWSTRYRDGAFVTPPTRIDAATEGDVLMPSLALDAVGDGLAVWTEAVYPKSSLRVARYGASSATFTPMDTYPSTDSFVFSTSVAVSSSTNGLVAWTRVPVNTTADGGVNVAFTSSDALGLLVTGTLGGRAPFESSGFPSSSPDVVIDAEGKGAAVWLQAPSSDVSKLNVVSRVYVPNGGWLSEPVHTLSERGGMWSTPRAAVGPDGSVFTAWREALGEVTSTGPTKLLTRGALRSAGAFGSAYELGLPSDTVDWKDVNPQAWTPETTVVALDGLQPSWTIAVGPNQTGFIAGASFDASATPTTRQLWLQRMSADLAPVEPILITKPDSLPNRPSAVKLGLNANSDGAVVWDEQIDGHYHVFASVLE